MAEQIQQVVKVTSAARFYRVLPVPDQISEKDIKNGEFAVVSLQRTKTAISITYTIQKVK